MRNEYRRLKFGNVPVEWRAPQVEASEQILISYLRTAASFDLMADSTSAIEVYALAKNYIGKSFKDWLIANFNGGVGVRSSLVRRIVTWIEGKVSYKAITSEVRRDMNRLDFLRPENPQLATPIMYDDVPSGDSILDFSKVKDRHFFEMIAVLGPELTAHFLLGLNGIRFQK